MKIKKFLQLFIAATVAFVPLKLKAENMTHEKWTKHLIKTLPFDNSPGIKDENSEKAFQLLTKVPDKGTEVTSFKNKINNPQIVEDKDGGMAISVVEPSATVFYYLVVPIGGETVLSAKVKGGAQYWTFGSEPTVITRHQVVMNKVEIGKIDFKKGGIKRLGVSLPKGGMMGKIEMSAKGDSPIVPKGGWKKGKTLTYFDMAQTLVQALDWGWKLPFNKKEKAVEIVSKKKPEALGGLKGFKFAYNDFRIKKEGFYSFTRPVPPQSNQTFLINGYLEKKVAPLAGNAEKPPGLLFTVYLKPGMHSLTINWARKRDPGNISLKNLDSTCEAYKKVFADLDGFLIGNCYKPVDSITAQANLDLLKDDLAGDEPREDLVPESDGTKEDGGADVKRRSLSPIMPYVESR